MKVSYVDWKFFRLFWFKHIQKTNGFKEMLQQPLRVNVPATVMS